ncbi:MAG: hypothetical protein JW759_01175, partial [Candidatus Coatesbacteria bacterium]|nr:hypothetical protein [Candidatus Coatesbacteria bacterium]
TASETKTDDGDDSISESISDAATADGDDSSSESSADGSSTAADDADAAVAVENAPLEEETQANTAIISSVSVDNDDYETQLPTTAPNNDAAATALPMPLNEAVATTQTSRTALVAKANELRHDVDAVLAAATARMEELDNAAASSFDQVGATQTSRFALITKAIELRNRMNAILTASTARMSELNAAARCSDPAIATTALAQSDNNMDALMASVLEMLGQEEEDDDDEAVDYYYVSHGPTMYADPAYTAQDSIEFFESFGESFARL